MNFPSPPPGGLSTRYRFGECRKTDPGPGALPARGTVQILRQVLAAAVH
jgi:hypothetical protein